MAIGLALTAVAKGLTTLKDTLTAGISAGNSVDEALRALGTSFEQQSVPLTESMKGLNGSLADRLVPAVLTMNAGLQGNSQGIRQLINQQKLTGTQYAATARSFAQLEALGGLQRTSTNALATNMIELGGQFEVTTDVLVNAVKGLSDNMIDIDLMGMPDHIVQAIVATQAKIDPALSGQFNKAMDLLFGTSMDSFQARITLGLGNFQTLMEGTGTTANAMNFLEDSLKIAGSRFEGVAGSINDIGIATAEGLFTPAAKAFVPLAAALEEGGRAQNESIQDFAASVKVIIKDVFVPLQIIFMDKLTPIITRFAGEFKKISDDVGPKFAHFLDQGITKLIEFGTLLPGYVEDIGNATHGFFIAIKNMDWATVWSNTKTVFDSGVATLNAVFAGIKEDYLSLKLFVHEITSLTEDIPFTEAFNERIDLEMQIAFASHRRVIAEDIATSKAKEAAIALEGLGKAGESFEFDAAAGTLGTFLRTGLDPFVPILTGIEENTAATASKLPEREGETGPTSLNFFQSTLSQAVGSLVGITGDERGLRAQEMAADLLLQLVEKDPGPIVVPGAGIITPAFD